MSSKDCPNSKHIMFQVNNFLKTPQCKKHKLLHIDKLILFYLSGHKGDKGIFPMQETLADELEISIRYLRTRLKNLEKKGFLYIENINRKSHYHLIFLSTIEDLQIPSKEKIEDPQIRSQRIHRSGHTGSTDATNNKLNNKLNNRESTRTNRAPLSPDWQPDQKRQALAKEIAQKTGKSVEQLISKFRNLQLSKQSISAYWDGEFENFLINERTPDWFSAATATTQPQKDADKGWWGPGHPGWESANAGNSARPQVAPIEPKEIDEKVFEEGRAKIKAWKLEQLKKLNGQDQHGELSDANVPGDRNKIANRDTH